LEGGKRVQQLTLRGLSASGLGYLRGWGEGPAGRGKTVQKIVPGNGSRLQEGSEKKKGEKMGSERCDGTGVG